MLDPEVCRQQGHHTFYTKRGRFTYCINCGNVTTIYDSQVNAHDCEAHGHDWARETTLEWVEYDEPREVSFLDVSETYTEDGRYERVETGRCVCRECGETCEDDVLFEHVTDRLY